MEYSKIIAVTAMPGLYELLTSKSDGAIVRSLEDKSTKFVSSRIHNFSHLESIEVFTVRENVNLVDIFHAMEQESENIPDGKDNAALKKYFEKVYPDLDFERVYTSDLKKMVKWFDVLKANEIEIKLGQAAEPTEEEAVPEPVAEEVVEAPKTVKEEKKAPVKKKAAPKAKAADTSNKKESKEAKPQKAAPKKKKDDK
ncbi:MAG TPA: DUF5606 domain-containing protein [Flavitalea sp.]|nr:DUF5606 domain-containing protein [Flavitalea sp.]